MAYGTIKVDNITFDNGGVDKLITVSGLFYSTSGALTVTGAISGGSVTAPTATFTTLTGTTTAGTTATFTSGSFTSLTGVTTTVTSGIFALGTAAAPSITISGAGIYSPGADQLAISTGGTGRITVDASGNVNINGGTFYADAVNSRVGIVTTSPGSALDVVGTGKFTATQSLIINGTSGTYSTWQHNGTSVGDLGTGNQVLAGGSTGDFAFTSRAGALAFGINTAEKARIDSSGRLLVGTSTARGNFYNSTNSPQFQIEGNDNSKSALAIIQDFNANTQGAQLVLAKNNSTTIGTNVLVANGDILGAVSFQGNDGSEFVEAATISAEVDGTPGADDMPGRLVFSTTADGAATPTERMRITSGGNVGIGIGSPGAILHTVKTSAGAATVGAFIQNSSLTAGTEVRLGFAPNSNVVGDNRYSWIGAVNGTGSNDSALTFATAPGGAPGVERMRIDSSGRLLVGTSSSSVNTSLVLNGSSDGASNPGIAYLQRNEATPGSGSVLGQIYFTNNAGNAGALVAAERDGGTWTPGSSHPGRLVFSTTADGAASPTERMRISADGSISIATNSQPSTINFGTFFGRTNLPGLIESFRNTNAAGTAAQFGGNLGYAQVMGDGDLENTNARYTGISDIKFKQNIEDASSQWDDIKAIQVRKYELIANPDRKHIGVIAQELEQTSPGLVIDREDLNGESYKSVAYSVLYMKAVKALQEAIARIETLEARLSTLEGA